MLQSVRYRVQNWDKVPANTPSRAIQSRSAESVMNLLALALEDTASGRNRPSEDTSRAIAHLWSLQVKTGAWEWVEAGLAPWELHSEYFGASLAAFALATIPGYLDDVPEQDR
jgi:hypothetical protein